jgi:hypothetical protein
MGSRNGHHQIVGGQLGGTEQHRTAMSGIDPEAEQIVGHFDGEGIGERVMPGGERNGIGLGHLEMKDGNQRLARRVRRERIQSVRLGLLTHNTAREARRMPLGP